MLCLGGSISFLNIDIASKSTVMNLVALGFDFNGQSWDTEDHFYNNSGGKWKPDKIACQYTETSGGGSIGFDLIITGEYTFPSTSSTYPGHYISCVQGTGNCFNGTDCVRD